MTQIPDAASATLADAEFRVVHTLRVRGFATEAQVAATSGLDLQVVESVLSQTAEHGHARKREGRISGWSLTPAGRARHVQLLSAIMRGPEVMAVTTAYHSFLAPNTALKQLITDWQLGTDKTGAAGRLAAVDAEVQPILAQLAAAAPWFAGYQQRLTAASGAFAGGDADALAKPMTGSYHDVWMELHEDLLATLGRDREPEDG
jgi:hypothetical protein